MMATLTTVIQYSYRRSNHSNQRKRNKRIHVGKEIKLSLSAVCMILCIEHPKDAARKLLELIDEFSKTAGYKMNAQKSLAFLHANNDISEREIK